MEINILKIGMKIKQLREKSNLTQKQVADYLSIDQSLVSKFEKGERSINSNTLDRISNLFCCPVSALLSDIPLFPTYTIAFRTSSIDNTDLNALSVINKIALNQFEMDQLAGGSAND